MLFRAMASYLFENTMYIPMLLGLVSFANTYLDDSHVSLFSLSLVCKEFWQIAVFFFVFHFSIYSFHDKYLCNVVFTHVSLFLLLIFDWNNWIEWGEMEHVQSLNYWTQCSDLDLFNIFHFVVCFNWIKQFFDSIFIHSLKYISK